MNRLQIGIAVVALIAGALFYAVGRAPGTTAFLPDNLNGFVMVEAYGPINQALPSFIHPFAFILLTAGLLACATRREILFVSSFWLVVDGFFEALQHDRLGAPLSSVLRRWLDGGTVLDHVQTYLQVGRFDWWDLGFVAAGTAAAFAIAMISRQGGNSDAKDQRRSV